MPHATDRLRRSVVVVAAAAALPVLSACASNFGSPVLQPYTPSVGVNDRDTDIDALDVFIVANESGAGTLVGAIVNQADEEDSLVGVTVTEKDAEITVAIAGDSAELPAGELVQLADEPSVSLTGDALTPGAFVEVSLDFQNGDTITFEVPVVANDGHYADVEVAEPTE
ncbi:MAG: hypothetical protein GEU96_21765 [Propionibacteriales bacterium]|nr:hypothetical protein [Propionibacteriales bacterium]